MEDLPLFRRDEPADDAEAVASGERTWGVLQLNQAIEAALQESFPGELWLRGEIQGLARTRMRRHWYFELTEKDPDSDQVKARVSVALLQWNRGPVDAELRRNPGFELDDDVEVRIRCKVGYYAPWGKLQLAMTGIDPAFTLGQMAANRERILRALAAEGLLERNAQLELPVVPRRVGLVTSVGSAAYNDFVEELSREELAFYVRVCDARVQGADTERTVIAGLRTLARRGCDVIVLVRGGGSRSDLAGFDSESIARCIATLGVPVLTGIGHEIDTSVADAVAHRSFKTPTACAAFLAARVRAYVDRMEELWEGVESTAWQVLDEQTGELGRAARGIARSTRSVLRHRERDLGERARGLRRESRAAQARAADHLQRVFAGVRSAVLHRLADREATLRALRRGLEPTRLRRLLARREERLRPQGPRLAALARRRLLRQEERLASVEGRVRALDPRRVLQRGYSLTTDAEGRLVSDAAALAPGQVLRSQLARGRVRSRVDSIEPGPDPLTPQASRTPRGSNPEEESTA